MRDPSQQVAEVRDLPQQQAPPVKKGAMSRTTIRNPPTDQDPEQASRNLILPIDKCLTETGFAVS